jgi:histidinol phosphatase-like enzyme (inositol monophosphatase family)
MIEIPAFGHCHCLRNETKISTLVADLDRFASNEFHSELIAFAHELANAAGPVILPHFRKSIAVTNKAEQGRFDPVTEADRAAETEMRRLIEARYPDHGIYGEEFPDKPAAGPFAWQLDPIDGTRGFITGLPVWGTLIGVSRDNAPLAGMMDQPYTRERFWSTAEGARMRSPAGEIAIRTRRCPILGEAVLAATAPDMFGAGQFERFGALSAQVRMTRFGGDCYLYCMLAAGFIDIVAEASLKPFDIAPLIPIIHAAGGVVTTWDGGDPSQGGEIVAAGDPALHEQALKALAQA